MLLAFKMHIDPLAIVILAFRILLTSSSACRPMKAWVGVEVQAEFACSGQWGFEVWREDGEECWAFSRNIAYTSHAGSALGFVTSQRLTKQNPGEGEEITHTYCHLSYILSYISLSFSRWIPAEMQKYPSRFFVSCSYGHLDAQFTSIT